MKPIERRIIDLERKQSRDDGPRTLWLLGTIRTESGELLHTLGDLVQQPDETDEAFIQRAREAGHLPYWERVLVVAMDELPCTPEGRVDPASCTDEQLHELLTASDKLAH